MVTPEQVSIFGLIFAATSDMAYAKDVRPKLRAIKAAGARCFNIQMLDHRTLGRVS
tara:strand:+ start:1614 stop:1781 length:168 start_codon:yes stop_codon:yes gene_type:complete